MEYSTWSLSEPVKNAYNVQVNIQIKRIEVDLEKIQLARVYAKKMHSNQLRKDGVTTQYQHLKSVADKLRGLGVTDDKVLSAAWLHDILEDTDVEFDDVESLFGKKVTSFVLSLTKDKKLPRKIREVEYIKNLHCAAFEAKLIKLCDINSNLSAIHKSKLPHRTKVRKIKQISRYFHVIIDEIENQRKFSILKILKSINEINDLYIKNR